MRIDAAKRDAPSLTGAADVAAQTVSDFTSDDCATAGTLSCLMTSIVK